MTLSIVTETLTLNVCNLISNSAPSSISCPGSCSVSASTLARSSLRDKMSLFSDSYTSVCWIFSWILASSFSHLFSNTAKQNI